MVDLKSHNSNFKTKRGIILRFIEKSMNLKLLYLSITLRIYLQHKNHGYNLIFNISNKIFKHSMFFALEIISSLLRFSR